MNADKNITGQELHNKKFNNTQIAISATSHFVIDIYQNFIIGLIPLITLKFGLSLFQVAILTATSMISSSLFSPIFGYLSDRYGLRYFLIAGPVVTSIFLSLIGIIPNYYVLIIFLFMGNLGIAAYHPSSAAIAGHFGGSRKGFGSSIINFGGNLGCASGILIIILIAEKINIKITPVTMIPGLIVAAILFKLTFNNKAYKCLASKDSPFLKAKKIKKEKIGLLALILLASFTLAIIWITISTYMTIYFIDKGVSLINTGIIMFLFTVFGGAGGLLLGAIFDKYKKGNYIIQAGFLIAIFLLYFTYKSNTGLSIILFLLAGIFLIGTNPVCMRMAQDLLSRNMSFASSLILGFSPGVAGITMIFLGKVADRIGIVSLIYYELIFTFIVFLILFIFPVLEKKLSSR